MAYNILSIFWAFVYLCTIDLSVLLDSVKSFLFLPSTERQRHNNPHENEYWQHFQQQRNGAGVPCVANPEKGRGVALAI